ncbi:hypothetical protein GCM10018987_10920 [Streptomyces cremeus]
MKLLAVPHNHGKLDTHAVHGAVETQGDVQRAQPQAVSLTQPTELGACYRPDEIRALSAYTHARGMALHLDGARLANAAAFLDVPLRACTTDAGVDILSFGGTKNGLLFGECVVVLNPSLVSGVPHLRKQSLHLASKMRFLSAQFEALLSGDLWLRNASQANAMAARLGHSLARLDGVVVTRPVEANAVFAQLPHHVIERLRETYTFYLNDEETGEARLMCSFDTTESDVDEFVAVVACETTRP